MIKESYDFTHKQDIKLKLEDTDSSAVVARGKGVGVAEGKGGQVHGDGR